MPILYVYRNKAKDIIASMISQDIKYQVGPYMNIPFNKNVPTNFSLPLPRIKLIKFVIEDQNNYNLLRLLHPDWIYEASKKEMYLGN